MQEKWEPEPVKLIWDLRVEERQQSTDIIHAVHLENDSEENNDMWQSKNNSDTFLHGNI